MPVTGGHLRWGSSPLTRGKPAASSERSDRSRLIPTHAGKTHARGAWSSQAGAHPHSRGENLEDARTDNLHDGSSPLTRGKRTRPHARAGDPRLIPTHAGKTQLTWLSTCPPRAHPHSRGENNDKPHRTDPVGGSSPLTRGKPLGGPFLDGGSGLIPAHAGKTRASSSTGGGLGAHPRSRGENHLGHAPAIPRYGSSPLTRGKPRLVGADLSPGRLIPAHAGKTAGPSCERRRWAAHPRSRGENINEGARPVDTAGSSPLTRGKHSP